MAKLADRAELIRGFAGQLKDVLKILASVEARVERACLIATAIDARASREAQEAETARKSERDRQRRAMRIERIGLVIGSVGLVVALWALWQTQQIIRLNSQEVAQGTHSLEVS